MSVRTADAVSDPIPGALRTILPARLKAAASEFLRVVPQSENADHVIMLQLLSQDVRRAPPNSSPRRTTGREDYDCVVVDPQGRSMRTRCTRDVDVRYTEYAEVMTGTLTAALTVLDAGGGILLADLPLRVAADVAVTWAGNTTSVTSTETAWSAESRQAGALSLKLDGPARGSLAVEDQRRRARRSLAEQLADRLADRVTEMSLRLLDAEAAPADPSDLGVGGSPAG